MSVNSGLTVKEFVHGEFGKINFSSHCNPKMNYEGVELTLRELNYRTLKKNNCI